MKIAEHQRLMAEQVIADTEAQHALRVQQEADMVAFKAEIVLQAAHENAALRRELVAAQNQIAVLNGKLIHHIDNPEDPRLATSGLPEKRR